MRKFLMAIGATSFGLGVIAFGYGAARGAVWHEIEALLAVMTGVIGLGLGAILGALERQRADQIELTEIAVEATRERMPPADVDQMHPVARARGRAPTAPGTET